MLNIQASMYDSINILAALQNILRNTLSRNLMNFAKTIKICVVQIEFYFSRGCYMQGSNSMNSHESPIRGDRTLTFKSSSWSWEIRINIHKQPGIDFQLSKSNITVQRIHSKGTDSIPWTCKNWLLLIFCIYKLYIVSTSKADCVSVNKQGRGTIVSLGPTIQIQ